MIVLASCSENSKEDKLIKDEGKDVAYDPVQQYIKYLKLNNKDYKLLQQFSVYWADSRIYF